jgi:hypothetical protein
MRVFTALGVTDVEETVGDRPFDNLDKYIMQD